MKPHHITARESLMLRRYSPGKLQKPRRHICLWPRDVGGQLQVLQGHASAHRTRLGRLYNTRARLIRRFGLSPFKACS